MGETYTATGLAEIAEAFDVYATDQLACRRWQTSTRAKVECEIKAAVWRDAASILRSATIVQDPAP